MCYSLIAIVKKEPARAEDNASVQEKVVGTRLHFGMATPLVKRFGCLIDINSTRFCSDSYDEDFYQVTGVLVSDAAPRIPDYDLVGAIQRISQLQVLPVAP